MQKNEQQNTDKATAKPVAKSAKPPNTTKAKKIKADASDKPEKSKPKSPIKDQSKVYNEQPDAVIKETNSENISPPTEMEVHHHPQLDHKPKPWKEYLLEGFMIFIAVMMGFIAENIREDITNNQHARQLTTQLVQDLKADTAKLNEINRGETEIIKYNDTLFNLSQQPLKKADVQKILWLAAHSDSMYPFHPSGGAIAAIKNELHLKQLSNSKIIGYIAAYESHIELLHTLQDITLQYQRTYLEPFLLLHFTPANLDVAFEFQPVANVQTRNLSQEDLTRLGTDMVLIRLNTKGLINENQRLKTDAVNLLKYITKEYGLEE